MDAIWYFVIVEKYRASYNPKYPWLWSQHLSTGPYPKPDESIGSFSPHVFWYIFILSCLVLVKLQDGLISIVFPTTFFFKFLLAWWWSLSFRPYPWPDESIHVVPLYFYAFPLSSHLLTKLQANFLLLVLPTKISFVFYLSPQGPQVLIFHCSWFDLPYPSPFITRACHNSSYMYLREVPFVK